MPRDKNIFTLNPTSLDMKRSVFNRPSQLKTSFNLGQIIPIYMDEILPGDTVSMDLAHVIRMGTPIAPIMDNIYADIYFFFVPNRLVWNHWEQFCGANDTGAWTQTNNYVIPKAGVATNNITVGCLADYFGIPAAFASGAPSKTIKISELPLRSYWKVYNDFFVDENSIGPKLYTIGDTANTNITYLQAPAKASRFHDLFSSCLPAPQKGDSVKLPLGQSAPVGGLFLGDIEGEPNDPITTSFANAVDGEYSGSFIPTQVTFGGGSSSTGDETVRLIADLSSATAATVNQVRLAFQLQKLLEKDARGGRYLCLLVKKIAEKIWKAILWLIRGEGFFQPQRIVTEIM